MSVVTEDKALNEPPDRPLESVLQVPRHGGVKPGTGGGNDGNQPSTSGRTPPKPLCDLTRTPPPFNLQPGHPARGWADRLLSHEARQPGPSPIDPDEVHPNLEPGRLFDCLIVTARKVFGVRGVSRV